MLRSIIKYSIIAGLLVFAIASILLIGTGEPETTGAGIFGLGCTLATFSLFALTIKPKASKSLEDDMQETMGTKPEIYQDDV